jgi:hypothetical protein
MEMEQTIFEIADIDFFTTYGQYHQNFMCDFFRPKVSRKAFLRLQYR